MGSAWCHTTTWVKGVAEWFPLPVACATNRDDALKVGRGRGGGAGWATAACCHDQETMAFGIPFHTIFSLQGCRGL